MEVFFKLSSLFFSSANETVFRGEPRRSLRDLLRQSGHALAHLAAEGRVHLERATRLRVRRVQSRACANQRARVVLGFFAGGFWLFFHTKINQVRESEMGNNVSCEEG